MNLRLALILFSLLLRSAYSEELPEFRPALLGQGPRSLINLINTESLVKRGQGNAIVLFTCGVSPRGGAFDMQVYRSTPNSELLTRELLDRSNQAQFESAIYKHIRAAVYLEGTVSFSVVNGKPHLRIFLNQEQEDLKSGHDLIAPQLAIVPGNPKFQGIPHPSRAPGHSGVASITLDVDTMGKPKNISVSYEHPPGMGFGPQAATALRDAVFIPAFRNGQIISCRFTAAIVFRGPSRTSKTG